MDVGDERRKLLELDPELGADLDEHRLALAASRLSAPVTAIEAGPWRPPTAAGDGLGVLVTDGFIMRRLTLEHRSAAELLGPGDLLSPVPDDSDHDVYPFSAGWTALTPVRLATLDRVLVERAALFPEVLAALFARASLRARRAIGHYVLSQFTSVEHRIVIALWHLAEDWGRVRADGVALHVPLTHDALGQIVGARRPTVTTALGALGRQGAVQPLATRGFLLVGGPPVDLPLVRGPRADRALAG